MIKIKYNPRGIGNHQKYIFEMEDMGITYEVIAERMDNTKNGCPKYKLLIANAKREYYPEEFYAFGYETQEEIAKTVAETYLKQQFNVTAEAKRRRPTIDDIVEDCIDDNYDTEEILKDTIRETISEEFE